MSEEKVHYCRWAKGRHWVEVTCGIMIDLPSKLVVGIKKRVTCKNCLRGLKL